MLETPMQKRVQDPKMSKQVKLPKFQNQYLFLMEVGLTPQIAKSDKAHQADTHAVAVLFSSLAFKATCTLLAHQWQNSELNTHTTQRFQTGNLKTQLCCLIHQKATFLKRKVLKKRKSYTNFTYLTRYTALCYSQVISCEHF